MCIIAGFLSQNNYQMCDNKINMRVLKYALILHNFNVTTR